MTYRVVVTAKRLDAEACAIVTLNGLRGSPPPAFTTAATSVTIVSIAVVDPPTAW